MIIRSLVPVVVALTALSLAPGQSPAAEPKRLHALSLIETPKYPPDFKHFDYVNPNAPKGGAVRMAAIGSFDSLNPVLFRGEAAVGLGLIYESLMSDSLQEPSTSYGLIAEWVSHPDDFSSVTFKLRDGARWHDGKPITVDDVIFSLGMIKKANPRWAFYYKNVTKAEKTGERQVTFTFDVKGNRELPLIMGQLTVLPKHYWTGTGAKGEKRDLMKTTLEPPVGSGPYRVKEVKPGRTIVYERVKDHWGAALPVNAGQYNFDQIQFEYYRDTTVALEAFKADRLDFRAENNSKDWATAYDFKAMDQGWVKRSKVYLNTSQRMQGFIFNIRRQKFTDPRVRRAFNLAFDFEWANKNLFYGQYQRVASYFENTELAATGLPEGQELEILTPLKNQIPPEVFTKAFKSPVNADPRDFRKHLRQGTKLLREAGWTIKDGALTHGATGERMAIEFMLVSPAFERVVQPYTRNLARLGIKSSIRVIDSAQYERRIQDFDYDAIIGGWGQSHSPGNEQRTYWGSEAAGKSGSRNYVGIKNPAIDKLIDKIIFAKDRAELVAATRALDRVLLWNHYVVPQWFAPYTRLAYWDRFAHKENLPVVAADCAEACVKAKMSDPRTTKMVGVGFLSAWWYDKAAAAKLAAVR
ncbi:MAG: extracellular solute-binding protein [Methyloligellaceae bacterium]